MATASPTITAINCLEVMFTSSLAWIVYVSTPTVAAFLIPLFLGGWPAVARLPSNVAALLRWSAVATVGTSALVLLGFGLLGLLPLVPLRFNAAVGWRT